MVTLYSIFQDFIKQTKIYIQNVLPKKVSELTNDAGYITSHQDISGKQDKLTFDTTPTANSSNPVTSGGVKTALDGKLSLSGGTVTGTVNLKNGLTSTGAIQINPNTTYYNEDIRLNESTNKWATIYMGAPLNTASGSNEKAWGITRTPDGKFDFFKNDTGSTLRTGLRLNGDGTALLGGKEVVKNTGTWGISITGNANTATKLQTARTISLTGDITGSASFDGSSNISINASRSYVVGETRRYEIDLSTLDTTKFYPIIFNPDDIILRCEIHSPSASATFPYNQNVISFRLLGMGWKDTPHFFSIDEYNVHTQNEITIGCIGRGNKPGHACVWVRGGLTYRIVSNRKPILHTEDVTFNGTETYTVGTNYYGGTGNEDVSIIFTPQDTIKEGSWHDGTAYGLFEKAAKDASGNVIEDTYIKKSGGTMTGSLNFANDTWNLVGDDSYMGDHDISGTFCVKGANGETGIALVNKGNESDYARISYGGGNINFNKKLGGNLAGNADTATKIINNGNRNNLANGTKPPSGLSVYECYTHAGYPQQFGNVLSIGGTGDNELFLGWQADARLLYRSKVDIQNNWTDWRAIAFTDEINNYAPTKTGVGASGTWPINISGTATKAIQDSNGNNIIDTYAKKTYVDGAISGAVGKITTYTGATSTANGTGGLVPAPTKGQQEKFLKADGTWADVPKPFNEKGHLVLPNGAELWVD